MHIRLQQIWHAVALAEAGSYTLAARRVHLSQPALSRSIKRLEAEFNTVLFDRTPEGVVPTRVGAMIIERGAALLRQTRDLQREVELTLGLDTGQLFIGAGTYPANISVGRACGMLIARHPRLHIDVRVGDWSQLAQELLNGDLDIAVVETSTLADDERLMIEELPAHLGRFICRAGHPLASAGSLTVDDIAGFPLVATSLPQRFTHLAPTIRVDTYNMLRDIVLHSHAVGLATDIQLADDERAGQLIVLPLHLPYLQTHYGLVYLRARTLSPAARLFMTTLRHVEALLE